MDASLTDRVYLGPEQCHGDNDRGNYLGFRRLTLGRLVKLSSNLSREIQRRSVPLNSIQGISWAIFESSRHFKPVSRSTLLCCETNPKQKVLSQTIILIRNEKFGKIFK